MDKHLSLVLHGSLHLGVWGFLVWMFVDFCLGRLTVNPIQAATQRSGQAALLLLILSLAVTPLYNLTRFSPLPGLRRPLGLYSFMLAGLHLFFYAGLDYALNLTLIGQSILQNNFILVGLLAFVLLLALALTSTRSWMLRLGPQWKALHRLVYAASLLAVLHFVWARKGSLLNLQGDVALPLLAGLVVLLLLGLRLPPVRHWLRLNRVRS